MNEVVKLETTHKFLNKSESTGLEFSASVNPEFLTALVNSKLKLPIVLHKAIKGQGVGQPLGRFADSSW